MLPGVYEAAKKDGTLYYRSGINFKGKHISLGSYATEEEASAAYFEADSILKTDSFKIYALHHKDGILPFEKSVMLVNFRDNGIYFKTPIYLRKGYFSYFLDHDTELKFDIDDLFYYSSRKIQRRQGHLFVSDYGMQYSILSRYGIRPYAVSGRDYTFANGDEHDFRYSNIIIKSHYHGVEQFQKNGKIYYKAIIHINGNYIIGTYGSEEKAAIAYNKAADLAKSAGIDKAFPANYITDISPREYADIYTKTKLSHKYLGYIDSFKTISD
jgi:hypothetical protein